MFVLFILADLSDGSETVLLIEMWILPKTLLAAYPSAQAFGDSNEELKELSQIYEQSAMWRSKALSSKTWLRKWKKVFWIRLQFGRILKPLTQSLFVEKYTSSLPDIVASHFPMPVREREQKTQDIFIPISNEQLTLFDLKYVSSKTSVDTSHLDSEKSSNRWKAWVIECTGEYSVRRKQAQAIREKEFLLWQSEKTAWATPVATDLNRTTKYKQGGTALSMQVNWPTPNTMYTMEPKTEKALHKEITQTRKGRTQLSNLRDVVTNPLDIMKNLATAAWATPRVFMYKDANEDRGKSNLGEQVMGNMNWGTPTTRDYKDGSAKSVENVPINGLLGRMDHSPESQDQDNHNTNGNLPEQQQPTGKLNPAWVAELMGIHLEKIFFVHLEIPSMPIPQN